MRVARWVDKPGTDQPKQEPGERKRRAEKSCGCAEGKGTAVSGIPQKNEKKAAAVTGHGDGDHKKKSRRGKDRE